MTEHNSAEATPENLENETPEETGDVLPEVPPEPPVGEVLRAAREAAGLSVKDVAQRFKLGEIQVQALESSDWERLPGATFVRGMVRSYARLLNLEPEPLLERVVPTARSAPTSEILPASTPVRPVSAPRLERQRKDWVVAVVGALFLLLAVGIYFLLPEQMVVQPAASQQDGTQNSAMQTLNPNVVPLTGESADKLAADKAAEEKAAAERAAAEKLAAEKAAQEKAAQEKAAQERAAAEKLAAEKAAAERAAAEKIAAEKAAAERAAAEKLAAEKAAAEKKAAEKAAADKASADKLAADKAASAEKAAADKVAAEKAANAKLLASGGASIKISFTAPSWVEVRDKSGNVVFSQTGVAGAEREVVGMPPFSLHIGNAAGVVLRYKGKQVEMEPFVRNNIGRVKLD